MPRPQDLHAFHVAQTHASAAERRWYAHRNGALRPGTRCPGEGQGKAWGHHKDSDDFPGQGQGLDKDSDDFPGQGQGLDKDSDDFPGQGQGLDKGSDDFPGQGQGLDKDKKNDD
jgi:hypothetical protein